MAIPTTPPAEDLDQAIASAVGTARGGSSAGAEGATVTGLTGITFGETQKKIAYMLLWIMIGVIAITTIVSLGYSVRCSIDGATCVNASTALDLLTKSLSPIFTAMIGLVGSVVGFYFGSKQTT